MPWTITSLGDAQITAGNAVVAEEVRAGPARSSTSRPIRSRSAVVTPGRMASRIRACISATTRPALRIFAELVGGSRATAPSAAPLRLGRRHGRRRHARAGR